MCLRLFSAFAFFLALCVGARHSGRGCAGEADQRSLTSVVSAAKNGAERDPVESKSCGTHSLFLLMLLSERRCSLDQVEELVPIGPRGSSLADLQGAGRKLGLPLEAVRCTPEALGKLALPAIAHLEPTFESKFHHYAVLVRVTGESVVLADGLDYRIREIPRRKHNQASTGYYLAPQRRLFGWELTIAWVAAGILALGLSRYGPRRRA